MYNLQHPSSLLHPDWVSLINATAASSEQNGLLHTHLLDLIYQQGWFKMLIPSQYGGQQRSLPEVVRLEEALSWADGSLGWVVTLCSGAGWFGGFLTPASADRIFADKATCLAGSGASTGIAVKTANGYTINGSWKYASGTLHATVFTANCTLMVDGQPSLDASGNPEIKTFIFNKDEVTILPTWESIGLKATGSYTFEVKDLDVPEERCFEINADHLVVDDALYKYPFLQLAEVTLAVNSAGMALKFLELAEEILLKRISEGQLSGNQKSVLNQAIRSAGEQMKSSRTAFYEALEQSWMKNAQGQLGGEELIKVSQVSRQLAQISRSCVDNLYPYCGLIAANSETTINRVWRDIHTASQHSLLTFSCR